MGFEESGKFLGLRRVITLHKRSKSFPDKRRAEEDDVSTSMDTSSRANLDSGRVKKTTGVHNSLKEEIVQLEKRLQGQFQVRSALERALGYGNSARNDINEDDMPKPATELIKEIAVLEVEVMHLEQYLLSLYRKAFDVGERSKSPENTPRITKSGLIQSLENPSDKIRGEEKHLDSSVHRCHSSLSTRSTFPTRNSPPGESSEKTVRYCHSQPLSMMDYAPNDSSNIISLAEHLGTRISDHIPETPNRIAEDMIKCIAAIYCRLSDPPLPQNTLLSPNSSTSSLSGFSPRDTWSPNFRNNSSFDVRLDNPFHVEGLKEFSGPYSTMIEVPWIYRDSHKLGDVQHLLQNFRMLISRLEEVDPSKLEHEEKLAFWINIHNALVMHAFLAYGIPQNNVKRVFLLLKAAYNIGGHTISADTIQSSILGCRMSRPGQWVRVLVWRTKFKRGDSREAYAISHREPLLHFALCSGTHSDPAVRIYTAKRVMQELESAKEEYVRASFGVRKDHKLLLPKIVESFAKDSGLCVAEILEMIQKALPESVIKKSLKKSQSGKSRKAIEWAPHNFAFRYLISKELVK